MFDELFEDSLVFLIGYLEEVEKLEHRVDMDEWVWVEDLAQEGSDLAC